MGAQSPPSLALPSQGCNVSHQSGDPAGCCHPRHAWVQLGHPGMFGGGAWSTHRVCSIPVPIMGSPPQGMGARGGAAITDSVFPATSCPNCLLSMELPRMSVGFWALQPKRPGVVTPQLLISLWQNPWKLWRRWPSFCRCKSEAVPSDCHHPDPAPSVEREVSAQGTPALPPPSPPATAPSCFPQEPISSRDGFTHEPKLTAPRERGNEAINQHTILSVPCVRDAAGDLPRAGRS